MIEVEVRSFLSEEEYKKLLEEMERKGEKVKEDGQITYHYDGGVDLRIQKNNDFAKLWLKKGEMHDKAREEFEVKFDRSDFEVLAEMLKVLDYEIESKWYRKRCKFNWNSFEVCIDHTPGYGRIIEIEKICEEGEEKEVYEKLGKALEELGIDKTPKEKFDERFRHYKNNWEKILREKDLSEFQN